MPESTETGGQGDYVVQQGDCFDSIGFEHGFSKETLWNHPANAELKQIRGNPNLLLPGDCVFIPPLRTKQESANTERRHRFRVKGVPCMLRIRLLEHLQPRRNEDYVLDVDGALLLQGTTDAEGRIEHAVPPDARCARLILSAGEEIYHLWLGQLDPLDQTTGLQGRLNALGFDCGPVDGKHGIRTKAALEQFQSAFGLPVDGDYGSATRAKMQEVYGC